MVTPDKKPLKKHFVEIPADINELTDTQIQDWAEKAYEHIVPILKGEAAIEEKIQEENGDNV